MGFIGICGISRCLSYRFELGADAQDEGILSVIASLLLGICIIVRDFLG